MELTVRSGSAMGKVSVPRCAGGQPPVGGPGAPNPGSSAQARSAIAGNPEENRARGRALLADGLRGLMGKQQAKCRLGRIAPGVQLHELEDLQSGEFRLTVCGVLTCKAALCPLCAPAIMQRRSEEITAAITTHGASRTYFATFTVRHNREMCFELLQKFLTNAFGLMFSGRDGAKLSAELGGPMQPPQSKRKAVPLVLRDLVPPPPGEPYPADWRPAKPHSVRAHDRTWSLEHGFHPHLHCLLFLHRAAESEEWLRAKLFERWKLCLVLALEAMRDLVVRVLKYDPPTMDPAFLQAWAALPVDKRLRALRAWRRAQIRELADPETREPAIQRPMPKIEVLRTWVDLPDGASLDEALQSWLAAEWEKLKGRCEKVFGARMVRRVEELQDGTVREIPFEESIERIRNMLRDFKPHELMPVHGKAGEAFERRAVDVEQVRRADRVPRYLAKLGCELSGMLSKVGKVDEYGIVHYGMWQLANIAADPRHELYEPGRGAWKELYRATKGTQTLTWSQGARDALGIDPVRDEEIAQEQPAATETTRTLGQIDAVVWDGLALKAKHRFLARIYELHQKGQIGELIRLGIMHTRDVEARPIERLNATTGEFEPELFDPTKPRHVKPEPPDVAPAWWNRREPGDNTREPIAVRRWSDSAGAYVVEPWDPSDARPRPKPPPKPDRHLRLEPISDAERLEAASRYVDNRAHEVSHREAARQLERDHVPARKTVRLPWEKRTQEERDEALHECRDYLDGLGLIVGGARPRRDVPEERDPDRDADEAADSFAEWLEREQGPDRETAWEADSDSFGEPPLMVPLAPLLASKTRLEGAPLRDFLVSFEAQQRGAQKANADRGCAKAGAASRFSPSLQERYGREGVLPGFGDFVKPGV